MIRDYIEDQKSLNLPQIENTVKKLSLALAFIAAAAFVSAQTSPSSSYSTTQTVTTTTIQTSSSGPLPAPVPTVSRTIKAMHYRLQGGSTRVDFHGTDLMQRATGEAKVEGKKTNFQIEAKFEGFEDATKFGLEYLTYVVWAISPQGRPDNLGELTLDHHGNGQLKAFTDLQTFGLIITAEPYFAVTQPGNMVVAESSSISGAATENIDAKYELVTRGTYSATNAHIQDAIFGIDSKTPLELFEARNALRIAHIANADKYAPSILSKAGQQLLNAESLYRQKQNKATVEAAAKEATQTAEEARVMAVKQKAEEEAQAAAAAAAARARADAEAEAKRRADAEAARQAAEQARLQAEKDRAAAEQAKAEAERMKQEALAAAQEAARQKELAEQAKAEAIQHQKAEALRQQAEREKQELRERLLQQLNQILATRDSARGLVANMSDVLFRSGSYELAPGARERLAKVSGIILAYPSLHVSVEGHTDSVGGDEYNQSLSELRAQAVRDYFVQQGITSSSIEAHGYGKTAPIASNDTPEGRQQNRRVELVLSGDAIGNQFDTTQQGPATSAAASPRQ